MKSPSRSPSRSRSRSPSKSRANSTLDAFALIEGKQNKKKKIPRWRLERKRPKSKKIDNQVIGFGSFYHRHPYDYSAAEVRQAQGHPDRVRTKDCGDHDLEQRIAEGDDSDKPSDWFDRTRIDPVQFSAGGTLGTHYRRGMYNDTDEE